MQTRLRRLASCRLGNAVSGVTFVCSAHPVVLRAALRHGVQSGATVLIEATRNQVNHKGGYAGTQPTAFCCIGCKDCCERRLSARAGNSWGGTISFSTRGATFLLRKL